ncbi:hypothetical protein G3I44_15080 [Halogeometricum borinquense]|uniref:Uncharacterized protein n=1 Tax=Halogeometricum borinquense TaxID=60847 RepID=A0A6C0UJ38_9EURY|nr:hypothetical protein [Halogeometricum borinquense]QIB75502.1 hypothetical protein G3I44_15080 [Halogeometricum borinquense]
MTAVGTIAVGSGTVLGTGAFDVTSSNSNSQLSIVTGGDDANLDIVPGSEISGVTMGDDVVENPDSSLDYFDSNGNIVFDKLTIDDLPIAVVNNPGQGMVNIQVAVAAGTPASSIDFDDIIAIQNNESSQNYEVGFTYSGYGSVVGTVVRGEEISKNVAHDVFVFETSGGEQISPDGSDGSSAKNLVQVDSGNHQLVNLQVSADNSTLVGAFGDANNGPYAGAGDFSDSDGNGTHEPLITEVTAGANEV